MSSDWLQILGDVDWGHMDGGWGIAMMFGMALFWLLIIALIVWLVRGSANGFSASGPKATPLEILDRRYAEGAITSEEYRERRDVLTGSTS